MAKAYKCDSCGELAEGSPNRIQVAEYHSSGAFGWTDKEKTMRGEFCDGCKAEFVESLPVGGD